MRTSILLLSALIARTMAGQNQPWPAPLLRVVDSVRIEATKIGVSAVEQFALRSDGSIAIGGRAELAYFDSTGRRRWMRALSPDVRYIGALAWGRDSLYVIDNATDQTLAIGANGGVGDIVDFPDYIRPQWKDRKTMPAYGAIDVSTIVDSTLVGNPRRARSLGVYGSTTKPDPNRIPVVRVNRDGIVQSYIATVVVKTDVWSILSDGRIIIFQQAKDSVAFIGISPKGDTLFSRKLPKVRVIFGAIGSIDGTFWVSSSIGGNEGYHTLFDARGVAIGRLVLPGNVRVAAGDARHLWVFENRRSSKPITRYTVRP